MNPYIIKDDSNKGIYNGEEVTVLERNYIYDYAKIIIKSSSIPLYVKLNKLH